MEWGRNLLKPNKGSDKFLQTKDSKSQKFQNSNINTKVRKWSTLSNSIKPFTFDCHQLGCMSICKQPSSELEHHDISYIYRSSPYIQAYDSAREHLKVFARSLAPYVAKVDQISTAWINFKMVNKGKRKQRWLTYPFVLWSTRSYESTTNQKIDSWHLFHIKECWSPQHYKW